MRPVVQFDKPKYLRLKQAYEEALLRGKTHFKVDGEYYLTAYARYLMEYLDQFFKDKPPKS